MITRRRFTTSLAGLAAISAAGPAFGQTLAAKQDLRVGMGYNDMGSVDPHTAVTSVNVPIVRSVYESLLAYPPGYLGGAEVTPALAESWEASPDRLTWTFHLRQGVEWHGGFGAFTADDVKYSIERVAGGDFSSPFRKTLANVDSVETDGDHTVHVHLKEPEATFALRLVNYQAGFVVSKRAIESGVDIRTRPIGTGPFEYKDYRARDSLTLVRNEKYWGGRPILDSITWFFMPDDSSRELALRGGDVHAIDLQSRQDIVDRVRAQGLTVDIAKSGTPYWLFFNLTKKPFDDIRVRQALSHALNRQELMAFLGKDLADLEFSPIPSGYLGHTRDVVTYPFDLDKARSLLADAGLADGFSFNTAMSNSPLYLPYMQVVQAQWKKIGVDMSFRVVDHPTYHRLIREDANPIVMYQATRYPRTTQVYLEQFYAKDSIVGQPTAITNFTHYGEAIPGVDDLIEKARFNTDVAEQTKLWEEAQRRITRDAVTIAIMNQNAACARSSKLDLQMQHGNLSFYMFTPETRILA